MIREATPDDAPVIVEIIHVAFEEYREILNPPSGAHKESVESIREKMSRGTAFIAEQNAGCVLCECKPDHLYIGRLAVIPSFRGKGIAKALLQQAERYARQCGLPRLQLGVRLVLDSNRKLFESMGYEFLSYESHPNSPEPTFMLMQKLLPVPE